MTMCMVKPVVLPHITFSIQVIKKRIEKQNKTKIYFCFIDYSKAFDCMDPKKLENSKRDRIPDHLPVSWETCVQGRKQWNHGTKDWFRTGKGVHQDYNLSTCLFNFYAECIMWNAGMYEAQAGIKIARRNNNLRFADDTILMIES